LVPIPPLAVQNKIVNACIAIDTEIKKANEEIGSLRERINSLVKKINGVKYKLGKIAQFKNGLNYDKSSAGEEVHIVGVADFKDNKSPIWDEVEKVVINGKLEDSFLLQKNDLLTVRSNGSQELVGRFMFINKELEEKTTFSGFTIRVRPDSEVVKSELLYYILSSPIIRKQLIVGSNGSNIKSLNQTLLSNVEISIPSMEKQAEILFELLAIEKQIVEQRSIIELGMDKKNKIIENELT
jgi:restriction endonuclease S subunit